MITRELIDKRQRWVLRNPCCRVEDCGKLGYRYDFQAGGQTIATVLTIDAFDPPLAWHATTALIGPDGHALPVANWTVADRAAMLDLASRLLEGVGEAVYRHEEDLLSVGLAKRANAQETEVIFRALGYKPHRPRAVGEIAQYDFTDRSTEVDEHIHAPQERTLIYDNQLQTLSL